MRSGSYLIARTDAHKAYLDTEARQSAGWGVDVQQADPGELAGRSSYFGGAGGELALWCPEDVYIEEPLSLVPRMPTPAGGTGSSCWSTKP